MQVNTWNRIQSLYFFLTTVNYIFKNEIYFISVSKVISKWGSKLRDKDVQNLDICY